MTAEESGRAELVVNRARTTARLNIESDGILGTAGLAVALFAVALSAVVTGTQNWPLMWVLTGTALLLLVCAGGLIATRKRAIKDVADAEQALFVHDQLRTAAPTTAEVPTARTRGETAAAACVAVVGVLTGGLGALTCVLIGQRQGMQLTQTRRNVAGRST